MKDTAEWLTVNWLQKSLRLLDHGHGSDGCSNVGQNRVAEMQESSTVPDHGNGGERHNKVGNN